MVHLTLEKRERITMVGKGRGEREGERHISMERSDRNIQWLFLKMHFGMRK